MVKKAKVAKLTGNLLVTKGNAVPSSAVQENLGADNVALAVSNAMKATAKKAGRPSGKSSNANSSDPKNFASDEFVALSIRLGPERHRRLELARLALGQTAEGVVIAAVDEFLDRVSVGTTDATPARQRPTSRKKTAKAGTRRKQQDGGR